MQMDYPDCRVQEKEKGVWMQWTFSILLSSRHKHSYQTGYKERCDLFKSVHLHRVRMASYWQKGADSVFQAEKRNDNVPRMFDVGNESHDTSEMPTSGFT
jgi:hypothetical protein